MTSSQDLICKRLRSLGIPKEPTYNILNEVRKWIKCSGEEWTVDRLKSLKTMLVGYATNHHVTVSWIGEKGSGIPKGPFSRFFTDGVRLSPKKFRNAINALMVYSAFVSPKTTEKQYTKFVSAVTTPSKTGWWDGLDGRLLGEYQNVCKAYAQTVVWEYLRGKHDHPTVWFNRQGKSGAHLPGESCLESTKATVIQQRIRSTLQAVDPSLVSQLKSVPKGRTDEANDEMVRNDPDLLAYALYSAPVGQWKVGGWCGNITAIQENGYKARFIANVHPALQGLLSRFSKALYTTLRGLNTDFHDNQEGGMISIQEYMRKFHSSHELRSIDLSSATDRFPFELQEILLLSIQEEMSSRYHGLNEQRRKAVLPVYNMLLQDIQSVYAITHGEYAMPHDAPCQRVSWAAGQPLGAQFSFALFSLAHNALLTAEQKVLDLDKEVSGRFWIVGDDLVTTSELGKLHMHNLDAMGVEYNMNKSIISTRAAEFAGHIIFQDKIVPQVKLKPVNHDNFVEQAKRLGPNLKILLTRKQQMVVETLGPIPPEFGGPGINPKGLDYSQRVFKAQLHEAIKPEEHTLEDSTLGYRTMWSRMSLDDHVSGKRRKVLSSTFIGVDETKPEPPIPEETPIKRENPVYHTARAVKSYEDLEGLIRKETSPSHYLLEGDYLRQRIANFAKAGVAVRELMEYWEKTGEPKIDIFGKYGSPVNAPKADRKSVV